MWKIFTVLAERERVLQAGGGGAHPYDNVNMTITNTTVRLINSLTNSFFVVLNI